MPISLAEAIARVDRGIAKAKESGLLVSFAVIDEFGQLVQLDRMDGAALMSPDIAEAKAVTALNFRRPTSELAKMDRDTLSMISGAVSFKVVAVPGGVPIVDGAQLKGAVGVSGATAQQDDELAKHCCGAIASP